VLTIALYVADAVVLSCCTSLSRLQKTEEESRGLPTKVGSDLAENFHLQRNRRVSTPLSPIFYLFLAPAGILYQKVQRLLTEDETAEGSPLPVVMKHRRPGPKHPAYSIPASEWPTVLQLMVEQKEPLRTVAAAYGVSHETIRRLIRAATKVHVQQEAQRSNLS
jgi:hypothetical protein